MTASTHRSLGPLLKLDIWHDNQGYSPSWYLKTVCVKDLNTGANYTFNCYNWLSAESGDGQIERELTVAENAASFKKNVTPDSRQPVHFVDDPELAYVIQRYREVHDFVHTLLGMPTNMLGETAVKWVEAIQTGLPVCIAAASLGPLRFRPKQHQKHVTSYLPWAINCGFKAKFLMNVYFEKRWEEDLEKSRKELNIPPLPA